VRKELSIFQTLEELRQKNIPVALVTVIKTSGSVPREVGAKMIVQLDGQIHGTVGGSSVEALVIKEAQEVIRSGRAQLVTHDLFDEDKQDTGMVCGGIMDFFIDPIHMPERVYIFGGGHVGFQVASLAKKVGFDYIIIDDRAEYASAQRFPDALTLMVDDPGTIAKELKVTHNDYIVIVTRGHKDDYNVLRGVIEKPARYIGMIGSQTKRQQIFNKLQTIDRINEDLLNTIHSPIGINIGSETPEEIAVSIVAELIKVRRSTTPGPLFHHLYKI
jgi:xanthine dehydrogenase accessory factor